MRKQYLLLSNLHIHNANAMSSSYTIGFPAITGWLGAVHALERNLNANGFPDLKAAALMDSKVFNATFLRLNIMSNIGILYIVI